MRGEVLNMLQTGYPTVIYLWLVLAGVVGVLTRLTLGTCSRHALVRRMCGHVGVVRNVCLSQVTFMSVRRQDRTSSQRDEAECEADEGE